MKKSICISAAAFAAVVLIACPPAPLRLDLTPSLTMLYYRAPGEKILTVDVGAYLDLKYAWKVGPNYTPPRENLRVFVHFRDSEGKLIKLPDGGTFQEDHDLPKPLDNLKPSDGIVYYTHQWEDAPGAAGAVCYPDGIFQVPWDLGGNNALVTVVMGLFDPRDNSRAILSWNGPEPEDRAYPAATFRVRSNLVNCLMPHMDNETWNGPEPGSPNIRWSKRRSVVTFRRSDRIHAVDLWVQGHSPVEEAGFEGPQTLRIFMHDDATEENLIYEREFAAERLPLTRIPIPDRLYKSNVLDEEGRTKDIAFVFSVDKVLEPPQEGDLRAELGFQFHRIMLLPRNPEQ